MSTCAKCQHPQHKAGECKQNIPPEPHMPEWTGPKCRCGKKPLPAKVGKK